jgi:hypothetical protein
MLVRISVSLMCQFEGILCIGQWPTEGSLERLANALQTGPSVTITGAFARDRTS